VFIEAKDDGSDGDNWTTGAINRAKLRSNHQQTNIHFLQAGCPSCRPTNNVKALLVSFSTYVADICRDVAIASSAAVASATAADVARQLTQLTSG